MFGRDSMITSLQALPFAPELAATTLRALGDWQGVGLDDFRDEDPGRILHEMRYGELTAFEERPHSPYYGSADATPLYRRAARRVRALDGDRALVRELEHRGTGRARTGSTSTRICTATATSGTSGARGDRAREPVLEGLVGFDLAIRDGTTAGVPARDLRAAGLRLRRQDARRPPGARRLEGPHLRRPAREGAPPTSSVASTGTSGSRTTSTSRSRSTRTGNRSTRSPRTTATCSGAASSTSRRPRPSRGT